MQTVCTSLQIDNHASTLSLKFFYRSDGCFSWRPTNSVKALKASFLGLIVHQKRFAARFRPWASLLLTDDHRGGFRHVQHVRSNRGPHKRTGKFLQRSSMPEIIEIISRKRFCVVRWRQKVKCCQLVIDTQPCLLTCTTFSPAHSACRVNSVGRYSYMRQGPHIFFWTGPCLDEIQPCDHVLYC